MKANDSLKRCVDPRTLPRVSSALIGASLFSQVGCMRPSVGTEEIHYELGEVQSCSSPVDGFARMTERAVEMGIDLEVEGDYEKGPCGYIPGSVVAQDIESDGDVDILYNNRRGAPHLYLNDGSGNFTLAEGLLPGVFADRDFYAVGLVDIDGDHRLDLWATGLGMLLWSKNHGKLDFGDWQVVYFQENYPMECHSSFSFGDIDADGDLDIALPGLDEAPDSEHLMTEWDTGWLPSYDRLYINRDGEFELVLELSPDGDPGFSLVQAFTDRDRDGDLDLMSCTDRPVVPSDSHPGFPPQAFNRNDGIGPDGVPILVNDAPEIGADVRVSAMGLGSNDLNGDGLLDYCMSDVANQLTCLMSINGSYYEGAMALGLAPEQSIHPQLPDDWDEREGNFGMSVWVSWGLSMIDFDNDGNLDMAAAAGPPPDQGSVHYSNIHDWQPDWIWKGKDDGTFEDAILETGFDSLQFNYGLVTADLRGDGYREIILGPFDGAPAIWDNPCGTDAWLEVELVGADKNTEGYGAMVIVEYDGKEDIQEMHNLQAVGQSVSRLHYGLGDRDRVDRISVTWTDGTESVAEDIETRRVVTFVHPDAEKTP